MNLTDTEKILETISAVCKGIAEDGGKAEEFRAKLLAPIGMSGREFPRFAYPTMLDSWTSNIQLAAAALEPILRTGVCMGKGAILAPQRVYSQLEPDERIKALQDRLYNQLVIDEYSQDDELEFIGCQILLEVYKELSNETPA